MSSKLDRALTVGGYVRDDGGAFTKSTKDTYRRCWRRFNRWCRSQGLSPMPASTETLTAYCQWLTQEKGYSVATAEVTCTAVRWRHRRYGHADQMPDRVAPWVVLRRDHATGPDDDRLPFRPACRDDLHVVARTVTAEPAQGLRDRLAVVLPYAWGVGDRQLTAMRMDDVQLDTDTAGLVVTVRLREAAGPASWRTQQWRCGGAGCGWSVQVCPVALLRAWLRQLAAHGITGGALLRPVDRNDVPAGARGHLGRSTFGGGLAPAALRRLIRQLLVDADLDDAVTRRAVASLRLGGVLEARAAGAPLAELAARAGYAATSVRFARQLALHGEVPGSA